VLPHHNFVQVSCYEQHMQEITKYKAVMVSNVITLKTKHWKNMSPDSKI